MNPPNPLARRTIPLAIVALLLLLSTSTPATAQTTGAIEGTTIGTNGFPMSGALVTVTGAAVSQESVTGADGSFRFAGLAAGDYAVTAMLPGFQTAELQVTLAAGATETVRLTLQIAYVLDTLSVVAEEPRIFARNFVPESMIRQQSKITNVTAVVDNLPGVSVQEGDAYGFDDWASNVAVRGFHVS
ncbi:MAG: carboxypeptidase-like regulatory domain-containing protein, partial [Gammaproteobacteria bacterium]|nr:carboxypeptidase-like regulatory domain-containing protein [Gammaproteobacteria bacterium]